MPYQVRIKFYFLGIYHREAEDDELPHDEEEREQARGEDLNRVGVTTPPATQEGEERGTSYSRVQSLVNEFNELVEGRVQDRTPNEMSNNLVGTITQSASRAALVGHDRANC